jgi:hypothetical protein
MRLKSRSVAASNAACACGSGKGLWQTISRRRYRGCDLTIAIVEQRQLQRAGFDERLDLRRAQGGDPVEPGRLEILADAGMGDEAAVAHHDHAGEAKARLELLHLGGEGHRVGGVALEHFDRDRAALAVAEQTIDDLEPVRTVVAAVAEPAQRAAAPFEIGRAHVIEHQRAVREMALRQPVLDPLLSGEQPVERP